MNINSSLRRILIGVLIFLPSVNCLAQLPPVPQSIVDLYNEVMSYANKVKPETKFDPPPPPSMYFDYCFPCDEERQAQYVRDSINFIDVYMGEETGCLKKANRVAEHFENRRIMKVPYDSVKGRKMTADMFKAKLTIAQGMQAKLVAAWKKYYNQDDKIPFLVYQMMEQHRLNALVGVKSGAGMISEAMLQQLFIYAQLRILDKATKERDYRVLLNIDWITALFQRAERMSLTDLGNHVGNYDKINQFLFSIETKAKTKSESGNTVSASLSSELVFIAKPDDHCHLKWSLGSSRRMYYKLNDISMHIPNGEDPVYTGTKDFYSPLPQIKLDFCDDKRDTAHFYAFNVDGAIEKWTSKGQPLSANISMLVYITAFPDTRQYTEYVSGGVARPSSLPFGFYVIQQPKNKEKIIVEKTIDAKDVSKYPDYVIYGDFKLKIEHVED